MGGRRQPDGMSEANLQRLHLRRGVSKSTTGIGSRKVLAQHFSLGAPHRPIAFSFHKSLLFSVNFFQDDTWGVEHKSLFYNELAVFRVSKTSTLKTAYYLIANDLRTTPKIGRAAPCRGQSTPELAGTRKKFTAPPPGRVSGRVKR